MKWKLIKEEMPSEDEIVVVFNKDNGHWDKMRFNKNGFMNEYQQFFEVSDFTHWMKIETPNVLNTHEV